MGIEIKDFNRDPTLLLSPPFRPLIFFYLVFYFPEYVYRVWMSTSSYPLDLHIDLFQVDKPFHSDGKVL